MGPVFFWTPNLGDEMTATNWKVLGKNDDVTTCECCGKSNLKLTVVLTNGESEVHYGRDCAARLLLGNNKSGSVKRVENTVSAIEYARKWTGVYGTAEVVLKKIANAIAVRWCAARVEGGRLFIEGSAV